MEAPLFEVYPGNKTLNTQSGQPFTVAAWQEPAVTDNSGGVTNVTCIPHSGSEFTIGQTLVTCVAVDSSGNNNTCSFHIGVEGRVEDMIYTSVKSPMVSDIYCVSQKEVIKILKPCCSKSNKNLTISVR